MYRLITKLFGWLDYTCSIIYSVSMVYCGCYLLIATIEAPDFKIFQLGLGFLYFIFIYFGYYMTVAPLRLLTATKNTDPKTAVELCQLWVMLSWIFFIILIAIIVIQLIWMISLEHLEGRNESGVIISAAFLVCCVTLALRVLALHAVYKFRTELQELARRRRSSMYLANQLPDSAIENDLFLKSVNFCVNAKINNDDPPPYVIADIASS